MKAFALMGGLLLAPVAVEALCIPKGIQPVNPNDAYTYVDAVIDSLVWIKQGFSGVRSKGNADFGELLYALKAAQGDYRCAADGLTVFGESSDKVIRESAALLRETYALLVVVANQRAVDEIVGLLDQVSKGQGPGMGTASERIANLGVMTDDAWKILPLAVIGVTYSLPKFDGDKPAGRFRITRAQRQALMRSLEKQFGSSVRAVPQAGQHALEGAAGMLYRFLADRKWRSADEP